MTRNGSPIFYKLLEEMADTHDKKSYDYANNNNPYGNYYFAGQLSNLFSHSSQDAGFVGRIGEKLYRLANLESSGKTPNSESIEDTERDLCVIMALWMASRRERRGANKTPPLRYQCRQCGKDFNVIDNPPITLGVSQSILYFDSEHCRQGYLDHY